MLAIAFKFLAGSYHANPWGRHVNEADVEWPPSPWRICRALIAVWNRKLDHNVFPKEKLEILLAKLSNVFPVYTLPDAVHSHTRHYMPVQEGAKEKPTLIFDAFFRIQPNEMVIIAWEGVELDENERFFLENLLKAMNYLGRSESWVEGELLKEYDLSYANCKIEDEIINKETGEVLSEFINIYTPLTPEEYASFRNSMYVNKEDITHKTKTTKQKNDLPENWLDAVSLDTSEIQKSGWSQHPASKKIKYTRPLECIKTCGFLRNNKTIQNVDKDKEQYTTVSFMLHGKPLPLLEDSLKIGELFRAALMSIYHDEVPEVFSGHGKKDNANCHNHAFYLPEDRDNDGWIDRVILHAFSGFDHNDRLAIGRLKKIYDKKNIELDVLVENLGKSEIFSSESKILGYSDVWTSVTPYLYPWYWKKKFGIEEQIIRECKERKTLPPIKEISFDESIKSNGRELRPIDFHRFRKKRGLIQPDKLGRFVKITFEEPFFGPLSLGFACHFGLGLFKAEG